MAPPSSSMGLSTPLEPERAARRAREVGPGTEVLMANALRRLHVAAASTCGTLHDVNEDAHSPLDANARLFVVADGVGGGAMAQLASRLLVAQLHEAFAATAPDAGAVSAAILAADRSIAGAIARRTDRPGAATVALCAPLDLFAAKWLVAWVGDCRVYRWTPRGPNWLHLLTRDDTFANLGEPPPAGGCGDDPARMVGNGATSGANSATHALACGDLFAVCSDGVHKHLDRADWCRLLALPVPLRRKAEKLVALARARGSADDATVLLVERSEPAWLGRRGGEGTDAPTGSAP